MYPIDLSDEELDELLANAFTEIGDDVLEKIKKSKDTESGDPIPDSFDMYTLPKKDDIIDQRKQRKIDGVCLECGDRGDWVSFVLMCPKHGRIAG